MECFLGRGCRRATGQRSTRPLSESIPMPPHATRTRDRISMTLSYIKLALFQMFLVVLVVFLTSLTLKTRFSPLPSTAFPVIVRSYGFLLLVVPAAWCLWACWQSSRPTHDTRDEAMITISGVCLCLALVALGWLACSAAWSAPIIQAMPVSTSPTPSNSQ